MNTLVQSLLLRRTKETKSLATGEEIVKLPPKSVQVHEIKLSDKEQQVYDQVFSFSQQAMINYMKKHQEKEEDKAFIDHVNKGGNARNFDFKFRPADDEAEVEKEVGGGAVKIPGQSDVKAHHLLVLLLRLRQVEK